MKRKISNLNKKDVHKNKLINKNYNSVKNNKYKHKLNKKETKIQMSPKSLLLI